MLSVRMTMFDAYVLRSCAVLLRWPVGPFLLELCDKLGTMDATTTTSEDSRIINFTSVDIQPET
jgi:hypothetical protein